MDRRHFPVKALSLMSRLEVNASHNEMSVYFFFLLDLHIKKEFNWQTASSRGPDSAHWDALSLVGGGGDHQQVTAFLLHVFVPP